MKDAEKYLLINGDEQGCGDDAWLSEQLMDLVRHNDTISFHVSDVVDGVQTIEVI